MAGNGGGRGIRTLETVARLHAFQACAFDHSATPPSDQRASARNASQHTTELSTIEREAPVNTADSPSRVRSQAPVASLNNDHSRHRALLLPIRAATKPTADMPPMPAIFCLARRKCASASAPPRRPKIEAKQSRTQKHPSVQPRPAEPFSHQIVKDWATTSIDGWSSGQLGIS